MAEEGSLNKWMTYALYVCRNLNSFIQRVKEVLTKCLCNLKCDLTAVTHSWLD